MKLITKVAPAAIALVLIAGCGEHQTTDKNGAVHCVDSKGRFVSSSNCTK